jgi:hypothetical protein
MDALRVGIAGVGAERLAQHLAQAARRHGVEIEPLVLKTPGEPLPRCDHFMLIAGDDDAAWRDTLSASSLPYSVLHANVVESALDVVATLQPRAGLLTRLQQRDAAQPSWRWVCEKCDSPECEHQSMNDRRR